MNVAQAVYTETDRNTMEYRAFCFKVKHLNNLDVQTYSPSDINLNASCVQSLEIDVSFAVQMRFVYLFSCYSMEYITMIFCETRYLSTKHSASLVISVTEINC